MAEDEIKTKKLDHYKISTRLDGLVIIRKISSDRTMVDNLSKDDVKLIENVLIKSGVPILL